MTQPEQTSVDVAARLKSVSDYVRDCERRVEKGEIMDLQGLDGAVIEVCEAIARLPRKEAQTLEPQMSKLITGLEELAQAMREQQSKFAAAGPG